MHEFVLKGRFCQSSETLFRQTNILCKNEQNKFRWKRCTFQAQKIVWNNEDKQDKRNNVVRRFFFFIFAYVFGKLINRRRLFAETMLVCLYILVSKIDSPLVRKSWNAKRRQCRRRVYRQRTRKFHWRRHINRCCCLFFFYSLALLLLPCNLKHQEHDNKIISTRSRCAVFLKHRKR